MESDVCSDVYGDVPTLDKPTYNPLDMGFERAVPYNPRRKVNVGRNKKNSLPHVSVGEYSISQKNTLFSEVFFPKLADIDHVAPKLKSICKPEPQMIVN